MERSSVAQSFVLASLIALLVACGGATQPGGDTGTDGFAGADGTGGGDATSGDTGTATDTGTGSDVSMQPDGPLACAPGVSCVGFPTTGFPTNASAVANCAGMVHRTDCCGARRVIGINHGSRTTLCPAEAACVAQYPSPANCTNNVITTDTGETTMNLDQVRVRCVDMSGGTCTCQTFVCMTDACRTTSVVIGSCGG